MNNSNRNQTTNQKEQNKKKQNKKNPTQTFQGGSYVCYSTPFTTSFSFQATFH